MEAPPAVCCRSHVTTLVNGVVKSSPSWSRTKFHTPFPTMTAQKQPLPPDAKTISSRKNTTVFPLGELGARSSMSGSSPPIKLLTRVEQLKLLTKAEKAELLSKAENFGLSLPSIEKLGLLSKAEELGVLSAATDPGTPGTLSALSLALLILGPACVYFVPEDYTWEVVAQVVVALYLCGWWFCSFCCLKFGLKLAEVSMKCSQ